MSLAYTIQYSWLHTYCSESHLKVMRRPTLPVLAIHKEKLYCGPAMIQSQSHAILQLRASPQEGPYARLRPALGPGAAVVLQKEGRHVSPDDLHQISAT